MPRNNQRRRRNRKSGGTGLNRQAVSMPATPGEVRVRMRLGFEVAFAAPSGPGLGAAFPVDPSILTSAAWNRWTAVFTSWRLHGVSVSARPVPTTSGISNSAVLGSMPFAMVSEAVSGSLVTPSSRLQVMEYPNFKICQYNNSTGRDPKIVWRTTSVSSDPTGNAWIGTNTSTNPFIKPTCAYWLDAIPASENLGVEFYGWLDIEFRGAQSV